MYSSLELENSLLPEAEEYSSSLKIRFEEEGRELSCPKKEEANLFIAWDELEEKIGGGVFAAEGEFETR